MPTDGAVGHATLAVGGGDMAAEAAALQASIDALSLEGSGHGRHLMHPSLLAPQQQQQRY